MDWVLLTIGAIFLICFIMGIYRGAIRIAVSLATTLLTLVIVFFATPYVAKLLAEKTPLDDMIQEKVVSTMAGAATSQVTGEEGNGLSEEGVRKVLNAAGVSEEKLKEYGITIEDIVNGNVSSDDLSKYGISSSLLDGLHEGGKSAVEDAVENADIPRDMQVQAIEMADLPDIFKNLLSTNNNNEIYEELGVETFAQYVGTYLAKLIINIVAFLGTFIIVTIILRAIIFALDIVTELPVLGFINRLAGGAVGIIGALIIVWILFIIVTLLYTTSFGKEIYQTIQGNDITKMIYENNPIMKLAVNLR